MIRSLSSDELSGAVIRQGLLDETTVNELKTEARRRRFNLVDLLSLRGRFPSSAVFCAAAEVRGIPFVDFHRTVPPLELLQSFPQGLIRKGVALPVSRQGNRILVASACPDDHLTFAEIERRTGLRADQALADPAALKEAASSALARLQPRGVVLAEESDSVEVLDRILREAYLRRASDVHIDPQPGGLRVRLRVDGFLQPLRVRSQGGAGQELVSRVKVLSGLDIAETRAPQDGGFTYRLPHGGDAKIDLRVATLATRWGERVTLRLLNSEAKELTLDETGMPPPTLSLFRKALRHPHGMILITGPTGSGKSTTLYAALRELRRPEVNIMTLEDPIESNLPGISQIQVGSSDKVTFGSGLRSMLRHDPDVMMVGEIRDGETAEVALRAAMTGHLIFSTLHTNDAPSAVDRLMDIGCQPYLIASTLLTVVAQRLVRRLCDRCKLTRETTEAERGLMGRSEPVQVCEPNPSGCSRCVGSGFHGRVGIFELLWIDDALRSLIADQAGQEQWQQAIESRRAHLRQDGFRKVTDGLTTMEEVLGVSVG